MSKKPLILGIESSCDETAAALITENKQGIPIVLSNVISSQVDVHKEFGGVVPELAARSHLEKIDLIVQKAINDSGRKIEEIDAVASTAGPGLIVCLSIGLSFGKAFASALNKPFILLRKKNKLPAETHSVDFKLEYGEATIEVHKDSIAKGEKILVIDDLIATGGTAEAAAKLIEISGGVVAGFIFVINLFDLPGNNLLKKKGYNTECLIEFPGH